MKIEEGIFCVVIALINFILEMAVKSLTDTIESRETIKNRNKKYAFTSLSIVFVYFICYYFASKTSIFKLTTEDSITLLIIFITSFLYFHMNGSISTIVKKFLLDKNWGFYWAQIMMAVNFIMCIIMVVLLGFIMRGNNIIYENTVGEFEYHGKSYTITIPKDTYFDYSSTSKKEEMSGEEGINTILKTTVIDSIFSLKKETEIELRKGTFIQFNNFNAYISSNSESKVPLIKIYYTDNTTGILESNLKVKLLNDTKVLIGHSPSYFSPLAINLYFLAIGLILYYVYKMQTSKDSQEHITKN